MYLWGEKSLPCVRNMGSSLPRNATFSVISCSPWELWYVGRHPLLTGLKRRPVTPALLHPLKCSKKPVPTAGRYFFFKKYRPAIDTKSVFLYSNEHSRGVSEAGYRAGLSRRRPRVRVPYIPNQALVNLTGAFFYFWRMGNFPPYFSGKT